LPGLAKLALDGGDQGVGLLYGAFGVGALGGTLLTGTVAALPRQGVVGARIIVAGGVALAVAGLMPSVWAAAPWVALSGAAQASVVVIFFSLVQTRAPADARGRVLSLYMLGVFGIAPLSYAIAALVGDLLGP